MCFSLEKERVVKQKSIIDHFSTTIGKGILKRSTMVQFSDFGRKPWTIVHGLIFGRPIRFEKSMPP